MLKDKLALLPINPGCYLMKDKDNKIIYVGKAKNLKNRVKSYFTGAHNAKTTLLVSEIADFEYVITKSELEAFILEINLIKQHDPKYNIKLTDDKTYPYIVLTNEVHPRLIVTRNPQRKMGHRYGPYPNISSARETVRLLNNIYPLRKCFNIPKHDCLYYHINQCLAPCVNNIDTSAYDEYVATITSFLKGNIKQTVTELEAKMLKHSDNLEFEAALECKNLIAHIKTTVEKQKIELGDYINRDIIGYFSDGNDICIHMFFMRAGAISAHRTEIFNNVLDSQETLYEFVTQYYQDNFVPKEILTQGVDSELLQSVLKCNVIIPQKGEKKQLVDLAFENAKMDLEKGKALYRNKEENKLMAVKEIENLLGIDGLARMEIFDNSNIMGTNPVSAMVCYINGKPSKKDYRKYKVKTVVGANDYETMKEVVYRRYYRVLMDDLEKPDLIIMDGGTIQVNACLDIINSLCLDIPVIGLKKDLNHKTESIIFNDREIALDRHSLAYKLLFNMQEEVHRFAISFHRDIRSKGMIVSILDNIDGIGKVRKQNLLKKFSSLDGIINASDDEFKSIGINIELANKIRTELKDKK